MNQDDLIHANDKTQEFTLAGITTKAKCVKVYDGDTVHLVFRPFDNNKLYRFKCRMIGYDCAELRSKDACEKEIAYKAKERLVELLLNKIVDINVEGEDKYGRLLVTVFCDNICINEAMVKEGHGVQYSGKGDKFMKQTFN